VKSRRRQAKKKGNEKKPKTPFHDDGLSGPAVPQISTHKDGKRILTRFLSIA
jgi:hypothetical protein